LPEGFQPKVQADPTATAAYFALPRFSEAHGAHSAFKFHLFDHPTSRREFQMVAQLLGSSFPSEAPFRNNLRRSRRRRHLSNPFGFALFHHILSGVPKALVKKEPFAKGLTSLQFLSNILRSRAEILLHEFFDGLHGASFCRAAAVVKNP
jgi:hypothetical protein